MNKTLHSIIIAGAMNLGYSKSQGQTWNQAHFDEYERRTSYTYKYIPKDTLDGLVLEKKKINSSIFNKFFNNNNYINPYKVTILAKDKEGNYFLLKEKSNAYRYKDLSEGKLLSLQRVNVIEKKYFLEEHKRDKYDSKKKRYKIDRYDVNTFDKGKYIGIRSKLVPKTWNEEEYAKIINKKDLEDHPAIRRIFSRKEKKKSKKI